MSDYLKLLLEWLKALILSQKTLVLAATLLTLYADFLLGKIPTTEALLTAVYAAIIAWLSTSFLHGAGKRLGVLK
jgi:hypothetical protein